MTCSIVEVRIQPPALSPKPRPKGKVFAINGPLRVNVLMVTDVRISRHTLLRMLHLLPNPEVVPLREVEKAKATGIPLVAKAAGEAKAAGAALLFIGELANRPTAKTLMPNSVSFTRRVDATRKMIVMVGTCKCVLTIKRVHALSSRTNVLICTLMSRPKARLTPRQSG